MAFVIALPHFSAVLQTNALNTHLLVFNQNALLPLPQQFIYDFIIVTLESDQPRQFELLICQGFLGDGLVVRRGFVDGLFFLDSVD